MKIKQCFITLFILLPANLLLAKPTCWDLYTTDLAAVDSHYLAGVERCGGAVLPETCMIEVDHDFQNGVNAAVDNYWRCKD